METFQMNKVSYAPTIDIKKWIQYKIDEHPNRLSSLDELKEYTRVKF